MKKIFRIFTTLALLGCANCGVSGTNAAAGEQTADPVAEAEAEAEPAPSRCGLSMLRSSSSPRSR